MGRNSLRELYKYTKREHAESMIWEGKFRIGTLHEYRNIEKYHNGIGDPEEGSKTTFGCDTLDNSMPDAIPEFTKRIIDISHSKIPTRVEGLWMELTEESEELYVFSLSSTFDPGLLTELGDGYDAIVRIRCPQEFGAAIGRSLANIEKRFGLARCQYGDTRMHHSNPMSRLHPALIKGYEYRNQHEVRLLYIPTRRPIDPVIVQSDTARRFCSLAFPVVPASNTSSEEDVTGPISER